MRAGASPPTWSCSTRVPVNQVPAKKGAPSPILISKAGFQNLREAGSAMLRAFTLSKGRVAGLLGISGETLDLETRAGPPVSSSRFRRLEPKPSRLACADREVPAKEMPPPQLDERAIALLVVRRVPVPAVLRISADHGLTGAVRRVNVLAVGVSQISNCDDHGASDEEVDLGVPGLLLLLTGRRRRLFEGALQRELERFFLGPPLSIKGHPRFAVEPGSPARLRGTRCPFG